jgi:hypothetical protein
VHEIAALILKPAAEAFVAGRDVALSVLLLSLLIV